MKSSEKRVRVPKLTTSLIHDNDESLLSQEKENEISNIAKRRKPFLIPKMTTVNTCTKTKDEAISQHLNNEQESNCILLLELDTINISSINFHSDMKTYSSDANKSLHKNTDENNLSKSQILSRPYLRKRLKQSRLAFYPVKNSNISKQLNMWCKAEQSLKAGIAGNAEK
ncbi:uncharacterized protein LOC105832161 isoform X3 [Monomorium pharaonis]|uniref:uncharacterized protein LOC105832161 isoform X3 n=1 Tax=Monomorium pharaonis TaxID=307658 RepID=UPI00174790FE|nr:uncharacterized protein LOC105832161 isoform X3 [Monomorium pharaonis]